MADYSLERPVDEHGRFWLPGKSEEGVVGKLKYVPAEGIELELSAPLGDKTAKGRTVLGGHRDYPVIHGQLLNGEAVSLFDAFVTSTSFGMGTVCPTRICANSCAVGALLPDTSSAIYSKLSVRFDCVEQWLSDDPFTATVKEADGVRLGIDVAYRYPPVFQIDVPAQNLTLGLNHVLHHSPGQCEHTLRQSSYLELIPHSPVALDALFTMSWWSQSLMSLLVGEVVSVREFRCKLLDDRFESNRQTQTVDWLFTQFAKKPAKPIHPAMMVLPLARVREQFPEIARRWFALYARSKTALDVFFGSATQPAPFSDLRFLNMVQALEAYDRSLGTARYMDPNDYERAITHVVEHIPAAIAGDHRVSLKSRLRFGNEYSLRKRLTGMLMKLPEQIRKRLADNVSRFVERVTDTRNYFAHYDPTTKGAVFEGPSIHFAAERLRVLMMVVLFHDLGVSEAAICDMLANHSEFAHALRQPIGV